MKKLIFIVLFVVIAVIAGGYAVWKSNQPSQWDVNLAQAVEDETAIVYYDSPIKSNTGVIGIWNKNDFPIDVYFYPYDGDAPVYGGNNVSEMDIPADSQVIGPHHLLKIWVEEELQYVLVARGLSDDVYMVGRIAVSQIKNLVIAYKERYDRNGFFQNLLLDNLLLVDI